jgi:hypothetical protein
VNLVIQEIGGVPAHVFHGTYSTDDDAKKAAEQWDGPPPQ